MKPVVMGVAALALSAVSGVAGLAMGIQIGEGRAVIAPAGASSDVSTPGAPAVGAPAEKPAAPTLVERLSAAQTLGAAFAIARPGMGDTQGAVSPGSTLLARWAMSHGTRWGDLETIPETRQSLVMKDSSTEIGKRICARGKIVEISAADLPEGKAFEGGIFNGSRYSSPIVKFVAFGSTGELVARKRAKFCGIVTGRHSYSNSGGGVTHAVYAVGMFDLPENK